jgi:hypothetical protein
MKIKDYHLFLKENAQFIGNKFEVLEWFIRDDVYQLYEMIMENMGIDEWLDEMSHRIVEFGDVYYVLEEEDLLELNEKISA